MQASAAILLLISFCSCSCNGQHLSASGSRCNYPQVQQMFDWAKYGSSGCIKLKSLAFIFGDGSDASPKLTAARFLTANLVFTGTVTHVIKDASVPQGTAYKITVQVHCFLKGRLSSSEIIVSGFQPDASTGLCLGINCQDGDVGLFFTTYINADDVRINENGFVKEGTEFDEAIRALSCKENSDAVNFWPVEGRDAPYCRRAEPSVQPSCEMSVPIVGIYLNHVFINFESDLKPECQEGKDFVMRKLFLAPLSTSPSFSKLSGEAGGASSLGQSAAVLALLVVSQQLLARGVLL